MDNPVADCKLLQEKVIDLMKENEKLDQENQRLKYLTELSHAGRLWHDAKNCPSPGMLPVIAAVHLVEAIRSLDKNVDMMDMIKKFHLKFKLEYDGEPRALPANLAKFRLQFLHEELKEYREAVEKKDLEGQLDALIDLVYVALGTAYMHGFNFNEGFKRVHDANMKKVRAATAMDSKRNSKFDVIKPMSWKPPYLKDLI